MWLNNGWLTDNEWMDTCILTTENSSMAATTVLPNSMPINKPELLELTVPESPNLRLNQGYSGISATSPQNRSVALYPIGLLSS